MFRLKVLAQIFLHNHVSGTVVVFMTNLSQTVESLPCIHDLLNVTPTYAQVYVVVVISDEM